MTMHSKLFKDFGIPDVACDVEVKRDNQGLPRLWFRSIGNPLVGLDLTGASQLRQRLEHSGDQANADEISQHIEQAKLLGIGPP
jgi:hypothetical protein